MKRLNASHGFTLIELLVVIAIIGIMASVVLGSLQSARIKARDTTRIAQLKGLETALNLYYSDTGTYPVTFVGATPVTKLVDIWFQCFNNHPTDYIPFIGAKYNMTLPSDPKLDCSGVTYSWTYASNGTDFKLITHPETTSPSFSQFTDPAADSGPNKCILDGPKLQVHYGIWSPGAACWQI